MAALSSALRLGLMPAQAHVHCISLAGGDRTCHVCSILVALLVLQVLAPGLRMGWATAAPGLLEKLIFQLHGSLLGPTSLSQARCTVALPCWPAFNSASQGPFPACHHLGDSALRCTSSPHGPAALQLLP